jgi:hypothetical protein
MILRNLLEFAFIIAVWAVMQAWLRSSPVASVAIPVVMLVSLAKTTFFGVENIRQLFIATRCNQAYHRFMMLMLVNMTQIILSFGLDYHCLYLNDPASFSTVLTEPSYFEAVFEFIYFSTLNFTFFGYGDVTPQTISAKLMTMSEIILAFVTVIFLLSDFISLKESLRVPGPDDGSSGTP